ncbi:MAG: DUF5688 family protein [Enterocloster clostridioformis]
MPILHGCFLLSSPAWLYHRGLNRQLNPHFQETGPRPETPAPFYVLSNRSGINGAACLLHEDVLKNFAEGWERI